MTVELSCIIKQFNVVSLFVFRYVKQTTQNNRRDRRNQLDITQYLDFRIWSTILLIVWQTLFYYALLIYKFLLFYFYQLTNISWTIDYTCMVLCTNLNKKIERTEFAFVFFFKKNAKKKMIHDIIEHVWVLFQKIHICFHPLKLVWK
jgi:hypothetical protein